MTGAYIPPHKRDSATSPPWTSLESLVSPDDSVSVVAGLQTMPLVELNEGDIACVLHSLGLGKYADVCMAVPLRGRDLAHCTDDDLKEIGIRFRPHRLSLLEEVAGFRANGVPAHMLLEPPPQQQQQQHSQPSSAQVHSPPPPARDQLLGSAATSAVASALSGLSGDVNGSAAAAPSETPTWIKTALQALPQRPTAGDNSSAAAPSETPTWLKSAEAHLVRTLPERGVARGGERGGAPPPAAEDEEGPPHATCGNPMHPACNPKGLLAKGAPPHDSPMPPPPPSIPGSSSAELLQRALAPTPPPSAGGASPSSPSRVTKVSPPQCPLVPPSAHPGARAVGSDACGPSPSFSP